MSEAVEPGDLVTCSATLASKALLDMFACPKGEWTVHAIPEPKYGPVKWASLKQGSNGVVTAMWPAAFCHKVKEGS